MYLACLHILKEISILCINRQTHKPRKKVEIHYSPPPYFPPHTYSRAACPPFTSSLIVVGVSPQHVISMRGRDVCLFCSLLCLTPYRSHGRAPQNIY